MVVDQGVDVVVADAGVAALQAVVLGGWPRGCGSSRCCAGRRSRTGNLDTPGDHGVDHIGQYSQVTMPAQGQDDIQRAATGSK
jgi:hypothetical protein